MPKFFVLLALLALGSTAAMAEAQHRGTEAEQQACARDVTRHCRKLIDQGDFAILGCLQQHRPKLSRSCEKVLADHGQ